MKNPDVILVVDADAADLSGRSRVAPVSTSRIRAPEIWKIFLSMAFTAPLFSAGQLKSRASAAGHALNFRADRVTVTRPSVCFPQWDSRSAATMTFVA